MCTGLESMFQPTACSHVANNRQGFNFEDSKYNALIVGSQDALIYVDGHVTISLPPKERR